MRATFRIRRFNAEKGPEPWWQEYETEWRTGDVVLSALHAIHEDQDATLAYRHSCRGAICGSCAMRISGAAALACKTQIANLDTSKPVVLEPLLNSDVIRDLVVDQEPFFASLRSVLPWLSDRSKGPREPWRLDRTMSAPEQDQWMRSTDCIMCQCCFSDCPKRAEDARFAGPATCLAMFKRALHPQEADPAGRLLAATDPGGVFDCDRHGNCVKVCPKDCRPMRAIVMLQNRAKAHGVARGT